jgi:hypothetical protein
VEPEASGGASEVCDVWQAISGTRRADPLHPNDGRGGGQTDARRATLATGAAALAVWEAQVERLKQEVPQAPAGADKQALSGDGAFVHLVGGEWAEVKTLAIGQVTRNRRGEVCTQQLSYCSRLGEAASFEQATLLETHRRGLSRATEVCAVQDGAEWLQGLVDYHRADAVRILDFAHAAEYINDIGQEVQAAGGRLPAHWLEGVLHRLKHQGPARVLRHVSWLAARYPSPLIQEKLTYLQKREAHMQYPTYQEAGWPIGWGTLASCGRQEIYFSEHCWGTSLTPFSVEEAPWQKRDRPR